MDQVLNELRQRNKLRDSQLHKETGSRATSRVTTNDDDNNERNSSTTGSHLKFFQKVNYDNVDKFDSDEDDEDDDDDDDDNIDRKKNKPVVPIRPDKLRIMNRSQTQVDKPKRSQALVLKYFSQQIEPIKCAQPTPSTSGASSMSSVASQNEDKIYYNINELIETEEKFVKKLSDGIDSYSKIFDDENHHDLPLSLRGKKFLLFGFMDNILDVHKNEFLPMLLANRDNYKQMFNAICSFLDDNKFAYHLLYNMKKKKSSELCEVNRDYFKKIEIELNRTERLGIQDFLLKPINRIIHYQNMFIEIKKKCFKHYNRDMTVACGIAEKKICEFLDVLNDSSLLNDIVKNHTVDLLDQGLFVKVDKFELIDKVVDRRYSAKVFLFEKSIIYTELKDKQLIYRGCYSFDDIGFDPKKNSFVIYQKKIGCRECELIPENPDLFDKWMQLLRKNMKKFTIIKENRLSKLPPLLTREKSAFFDDSDDTDDDNYVASEPRNSNNSSPYGTLRKQFSFFRRT